MMEMESFYYTEGPHMTNHGVKNFPCETFSKCQPNDHQGGLVFKYFWGKKKSSEIPGENYRG